MRMCVPTGGLLAALAVVFGTAVAFAPVPRITWEHQEVQLTQFHEPGIFNYSALLLSEDKDTLYVGAREAVFALNAHNISRKLHEAYWKVSEDKKAKCAEKGKSKQTECLNYIRVLQPLSANALYVCGTNAFQPACDHLSLTSFQFLGKNEDGKGRCPFDPAQSYTSVMVDGELYSGTSYNFLGSEPIISRNSSHSPLRTEYAIPWLNEPSFVFSDVIRESLDDGEDDRVYFFFTEVSVEYEFVFKLLIPRVARVCKGDQGGLRTLQKKWTSFLKARLICSRPESNLVFNVLRDVFVLRAPGLKEPVFYGVFTPQLNNVGLSAVCAYNLSTAEAVFASGKYMQSATVEQSHTKWVRYNGPVPTPQPGACINREARAANLSSSLNLPDKTLQFVKDHPLMDDSVTPVDNRPRLVKTDANYTQIVVDRTQALDGTVYDVMFVSTDRGALHKAINLENDVHIIEETQLFQDFEPVQTLLLSSKKGRRFIYAGSNSGVVQAPVAFCGQHGTCEDCVLARDPYCAWSPAAAACVTLHQTDSPSRELIQEMSGDTSACPASSPLPFPPPGSSSLSCLGPDSPSSPRSPWPASGVGPDSRPRVTLLPPFLSDQAQHVHALGTFHLFCQATVNSSHRQIESTDHPARNPVVCQSLAGGRLGWDLLLKADSQAHGHQARLLWLRSRGRPLPLGEEWARAGGVRPHADPHAARRPGPRAQLAARRHPGGRRVPLLCAVHGGEPDLPGAHRRDGTRGDPPREVDQRARRLEGRGRGARPHGAELEEGVGKLRPGRLLSTRRQCPPQAQAQAQAHTAATCHTLLSGCAENLEPRVDLRQLPECLLLI
ncbi:semaphorin-4D isoform X2 [Camelus ferus]|uniref:Semaphorin-4D isoform X2 n=1 Tax=Camelus ferus TaxID=419612 RepID=A0A8B8S8W5_CAMFR|nr:semaphorin-4D isoform X2 [Camelus ferus]XP_032326673.1 semaphorin-4D isoform X2 [Camelus ferus]